MYEYMSPDEVGTYNYLSATQGTENANSYLKSLGNTLNHRMEEGGPGSYLRKSLNQLVYGNYTDEITLLGTAGQIITGLLGIDLPADIRDIVYDLSNFKATPEHTVQTLLDIVGILPVIGVLKNADEAALLFKNAVKNSDEAAAFVKGLVKKSDEAGDLLDSSRIIGKEFIEGAGDAGKYIDNTTDALTKAEQQVVDDLVGKGKKIERIPKDPKAIDKTPDFKVDGVNTELKTLNNPNTSTGMKRIQEGFKQHADTVIIDARGSGLSAEQAGEIINRAKGKYPNGYLPGKVEIWIDGQVITYP